jgi:arylsulfatase A-like enzyme
MVRFFPDRGEACALSSVLALVCLGSAGCGEPRASLGDNLSEMPTHLEALLAAAAIEGSAPPSSPPAAEAWDFGDVQPAWKPVGFGRPQQLPRAAQVGDALRLTLPFEEPAEGGLRHGGLYLEVPEWDLEDWAYVVVRLRTSDPVDHLELGFNLAHREPEDTRPGPFDAWSPQIPLITDGSAQSYVVRLDRFGEDPPEGTLRELGIVVGAAEPATVELLSVSIVPKEADFAVAGYGVQMAQKQGEHRRAFFVHGRSRVEFVVEVPPGGRLDFGLGVLRDEPVTFRVSAASEGDPPAAVFEETYSDPREWAMRSVDLSSFAGRAATLALETDTVDGAVALWGTPILSGERRSRRPNVVFYIIDGAGADYMSLLGYNRENTPHLSRLAEQGAVFERAYSSASWTKPSTASFMTSIPHSALGGYRGDTDLVPEGAVTMAEHLHGVGYQTAVIVSNPYSASLSGLERGADFLHETGVEPNNSESSRLLHESFWRWRSSLPGEPYWVHFQSTDIHEPFAPVAPFSGLYVDPALREGYERWDPDLYPGGGWRDPSVYLEHGIDVARYAHAQQGLYDEAMAHNDARIGELVARIQERGEWDNTLLIVAADHGYPAACHRLMEPLGPMWGPMLNSHETRVPMLFVWPGRIAGGQRFAAPVSMLDMLPTVLDLLDLEVPETAQGRSLAPLLLGEGEWEPQPVFLDEFYVDGETGELEGLIEVVDGWWGASLEIGEGAANEIGGVGARTEERRPAPLLLYDLRDDPFTQHSLHEQRPDLVEKYTRLLQRRRQAHLELGEALGEGGQAAVGVEQLEALRALGYID